MQCHQGEHHSSKRVRELTVRLLFALTYSNSSDFTVDAVEPPMAKSLSPTRILEPKRPPRLKTMGEQTKPLAKPASLKPVDIIAKNELETLMRKPAYTSDEK